MSKILLPQRLAMQVFGPGVADGQDVPGMTVRFREVEALAAEKHIDFAVPLM